MASNFFPLRQMHPPTPVRLRLVTHPGKPSRVEEGGNLVQREQVAHERGHFRRQCAGMGCPFFRLAQPLVLETGDVQKGIESRVAAHRPDMRVNGFDGRHACRSAIPVKQAAKSSGGIGRIGERRKAGREFGVLGTVTRVPCRLVGVQGGDTAVGIGVFYGGHTGNSIAHDTFFVKAHRYGP